MLVACTRCNVSDRVPKFRKCRPDCEMCIVLVWEKRLGEVFPLNREGGLTQGYVHVPARFELN